MSRPLSRLEINTIPTTLHWLHQSINWAKSCVLRLAGLAITNQRLGTFTVCGSVKVQKSRFLFGIKKQKIWRLLLFPNLKWNFGLLSVNCFCEQYHVPPLLVDRSDFSSRCSRTHRTLHSRWIWHSLVSKVRREIAETIILVDTKTTVNRTMTRTLLNIGIPLVKIGHHDRTGRLPAIRWAQCTSAPMV